MNRRFCDGVHRRDLLRLGCVGLFGGGMSLSSLLRLEADDRRHHAPRDELRHAERDDYDATRRATGVSVIYVFLKGGMSTIDTFDLKPQAPAEIRGEFSPIPTMAPGVQISECLPRTATQMGHISLLRGFGHKNSDHGPADHYMLTGYAPGAGFNPNLSPNNVRPSFGSIIARKTGAPDTGVPPFVCLPKFHPSCGPAYLGAACAPLAINADPAAPDFTVPDLLPPFNLAVDRLENRRALLRDVDKFQRSAEREANNRARTVDVFRQRAFELMTSSEAKKAFNLSEESDKLRDEYGRTTLGQSCLMARRLVESGVRCVTIDHTNWDNHDNIFSILRQELLPQFDPAISTLFRDLSDRGLLKSTLVIIAGEFGRTPRINKNAGRDHWGPSFTVAVGGGGLKGGRVVGASDDRAERPADKPIGPEDLAATMFHLLGIPPQEEFHTPEGRPVKICNEGRVIWDLL